LLPLLLLLLLLLQAWGKMFGSVCEIHMNDESASKAQLMGHL
jgi:hypothetical protein